MLSAVANIVERAVVPAGRLPDAPEGLPPGADHVKLVPGTELEIDATQFTLAGAIAGSGVEHDSPETIGGLSDDTTTVANAALQEPTLQTPSVITFVPGTLNVVRNPD